MDNYIEYVRNSIECDKTECDKEKCDKEKCDKNELFSKYWLYEHNKQMVFRPKAIKEGSVGNITPPKRNFETSVIFKILSSVKFEMLGVIVLSGFQRLRNKILNSIDIDTLVFTDYKGCLEDTHYKSYIQNFDDLENKIRQDFDLYIFDFHETVNFELLNLPFRLMMNKNIETLPYMIIFTPILDSDSFNKLTELYGTVLLPKQDCPELKYFDYRSTQDNRGRFDENYVPLDEQEVISYYTKTISENNKFKINVHKRLLVVTTDLDYAGIEFIRCLNAPGVVIHKLNIHGSNRIHRFNRDQIPDYYFEVEEIDEEERAPYDLDEIYGSEFMNYDDLVMLINQTPIVIVEPDTFEEMNLSTFSFYFVINTYFEWDIITRFNFIASIQNCKTKMLLVYSPPIASNLFTKGIKESKKILYDLNYESRIFNTYNVIQLNNL